MRRLVQSAALVLCLAACARAAGETLTEPDGAFGGLYHLRQINDARLPVYFAVSWYPGRGSTPGMMSTSLLSADLLVRPDGKFTWVSQLEELATKPNTNVPEYVVWKVRREADGLWTHEASTGEVSLTGTDQSGTYVLTGVATGTGLTLSTRLADGLRATFVLER